MFAPFSIASGQQKATLTASTYMKRILAVLLLNVWLLTAQAALQFTPEQAGKIAQTVGAVLDTGHYSHARFDDTVSQTFLKNYLDALDYYHMVLRQSDVEEFTKRYGKTLDDYTMTKGDASPCFEIFGRYLKRLEERTQLAKRLLHEPQDFSTDDKFALDRRKLPWPKDEAEAEQLWRTRIKFELLADKLAYADKVANAVKHGKPEPKGKLDAPAPETKTKPPEPYNPAKTIELLAKRYDRLLKFTRDQPNTETLQVYLSSLGHAYDPHSDYMAPAEAKDFDIKNIKMSLTGIGALLRFEDGYTRIENLVPGGPAESSKQLKPGDRIIAVAQGDSEPVDSIEMPINQVVDMIRGKLNTEVRLTIIPASSPDGSEKRIIKLIRKEIPLSESLAKARVIDHRDENGKTQRLGVINLPGFYDHCSRDVDKLIERLKKENITGLVLDLRRNGGGLLPEAVDLAGLFIKKGPIVQVKDTRSRITVLEDENENVSYDGPLIVLVSHLSASASEIVAAALQDYGRALIVGDLTTHGKGTVQNLLSLAQGMRPGVVADPGKLKYTTSKFYRIAGGTTQKEGVTPSILLPSVYDYMELGEKNLPNCLPADKIAPARHEMLDRVQPHVAELQKKSAARIAKSQDFVYLNEDIEDVKKRQADKTISLNETKRLDEKAEQKKRFDARLKERAERKPLEEKIYSVTLKSVDENRPLVPIKTVKAKENDSLATANADDAEMDKPENEAEGTVDMHLAETLNILTDYANLLAKSRTDKLVVKPK